MAVRVAVVPTPGFKRKAFKLCVLTRWDFNFFVRSSSLRGTDNDAQSQPANPFIAISITQMSVRLGVCVCVCVCVCVSIKQDTGRRRERKPRAISRRKKGEKQKQSKKPRKTRAKRFRALVKLGVSGSGLSTGPQMTVLGSATVKSQHELWTERLLADLPISSWPFLPPCSSPGVTDNVAVVVVVVEGGAEERGRGWGYGVGSL